MAPFVVKCNTYKEKQATAKLAFVFLYLLTSKCFCEAEDNMCEAHDLRVCKNGQRSKCAVK